MRKDEREINGEELAETIMEAVDVIGEITGEDLRDVITDFTNDLLRVAGVGIEVHLKDQPREAEEQEEVVETGHYAYTSKEGYKGESSQEDPKERKVMHYTNEELKEDFEDALGFMQNIMDAILDDKAETERELETLKGKHNGLLGYLKGEK